MDSLIAMLGSSFQRAPWGWGILGILIGGAFKFKPVMQALANKREANLLEERAHEMASMREEIRLLSEELRVVRHDLNNANQSLDLFIELIEANPERAAEHARRVKIRRDEGRRQIAGEKVALTEARAASIAKEKP